MECTDARSLLAPPPRRPLEPGRQRLAWRSDGRAAGPPPITTPAGNTITLDFGFADVAGTLYFSGTGDGFHGVWQTDGTQATASPAQSFVPGVNPVFGVSSSSSVA